MSDDAPRTLAVRPWIIMPTDPEAMAYISDIDAMEGRRKAAMHAPPTPLERLRQYRDGHITDLGFEPAWDMLLQPERRGLHVFVEVDHPEQPTLLALQQYDNERRLVGDVFLRRTAVPDLVASLEQLTLQEGRRWPTV